MNFRIGQGFDAHQLAAGYDLIVGGVHIPNELGSKGHSDGDVLYHAVVDAMLGALALGDIGGHFPSADNRWKGADSSVFVSHCLTLVSEKGYSVENVDTTIMLQEPRLSAHIHRMKENLSHLLHISADRISVKATTTDHMGFTGRSEGLAAMAVILLRQQEQ